MPTLRTSDDVTLHYTDEGRGRAVVLIHGFTAPASAWALTVDALLGAGYRVITFDRRSHGESESPDHGQRMARHGRDLGELLGQLQLEDVVLVGASMGGNTIWAYLDQYGPTGAAAVVVVDQTPKMLNTPDWPYGFYDYDASNALSHFAQGVPQTGRGRATEPLTPAMTRLMERLGGPPAFRDSTAAQTLPLLTDHALADWRDVIQRFRGQILMIAAREGQVWPCEHAEAALAGHPNGRVAIVEDSGHAVSFDQPDVFNDLLLDFLAQG